MDLFRIVAVPRVRLELFQLPLSFACKMHPQRLLRPIIVQAVSDIVL